MPPASSLAAAGFSGFFRDEEVISCTGMMRRQRKTLDWAAAALEGWWGWSLTATVDGGGLGLSSGRGFKVRRLGLRDGSWGRPKLDEGIRKRSGGPGRPFRNYLLLLFLGAVSKK